MEIPASLKKIKPYLEQGRQRAADPVISYFCNLHALQEAMAIRSQVPKADMGFIMTLMDQVEAQKATLPEVDSPAMQMENAAMELFQKADDADRAGNHGLQTAKDFMAAATLFEVGKQWGDLPEDVAERVKYGKWRFVELCKAAKERRAPPPPRGTEGDGSAGPGDGSSAAGVHENLGEPSAVPYGAPPTQPVVAAGAPPDYLDLPPAAPDHTAFNQMHVTPPVVGGGGASAPPQSSFGAPSVPQQPPAHAFAPPSVVNTSYAPPHGAPPAYPPTPMASSSFRPSTAAMMDAARLCQSAASNLQFQDHTTAVATLYQALQLLTQPPAPQPP